jgi:hypothetical protein
LVGIQQKSRPGWGGLFSRDPGQKRREQFTTVYSLAQFESSSVTQILKVPAVPGKVKVVLFRSSDSPAKGNVLHT